MTGPYRCSDGALQRGDPLLATAAPIRRWLLIEEPGSWGAEGLTTSPIDRQVAGRLAEKARAASVRVQLIQRPGPRRRRATAPAAIRRGARRAYALVAGDPGAERTWWGSVTSDQELLDVPLDDPGYPPDPGPVYLVCTHGRKDVCCALRGRPIAHALAAHRPEATWETSHVGGDRFAGNLVVLPHGLYYGRITADTALRAATAYEERRVLPHYLRGRSTHHPPAQAAECHARLELSESRLDTLAPRQVVRQTPDQWRITLGWDASTVVVTVRAVMSPLPAQLTCGNVHPSHYRTFDLVGLRVAH
ncbi:MAG: sucrase ferredoxin [Micromonosporaceae bacterium]